MPYRKARGGYRIHRRVGRVAGVEVGDLDIPIGTKSKAVAERVEDMVSSLMALGEPGAALLLDLKHKRRKPLDVLHTFNSQRVKNAGAIVGEERLDAAWERFIAEAKRKDGTPLSEGTKRSYRYKLGALLADDPDAYVRDLPKLLERARDRYIAAKQFKGFNEIRKACLSFARCTQAQKQFSELWRAVALVSPTLGAVRKTNSAQPVWFVRQAIQKLEGPRMQSVAWFLALTGARIGEYGRCEILSDRIAIHGSKTQAAERIIPLLSDDLTLQPMYYAYGEEPRNVIEPDASPVNYDEFLRALRKASDGKLGPHDLRHSYRLWLDEAGVPDLRADMYMGHSTASLKETYARHALDLRLAEDTERLADYLRKNWNAPTLRKAKKIQRLKIA